MKVRLCKEGNITKYWKAWTGGKPWNAGAQFSSLCLFVSTQIDDDKYKQIQKKS